MANRHLFLALLLAASPALLSPAAARVQFGLLGSFAASADPSARRSPLYGASPAGARLVLVPVDAGFEVWSAPDALSAPSRSNVTVAAPSAGAAAFAWPHLVVAGARGTRVTVLSAEESWAAVNGFDVGGGVVGVDVVGVAVAAGAGDDGLCAVLTSAGGVVAVTGLENVTLMTDVGLLLGGGSVAFAAVRASDDELVAVDASGRFYSFVLGGSGDLRCAQNEAPEAPAAAVGVAVSESHLVLSSASQGVVWTRDASGRRRWARAWSSPMLAGLRSVVLSSSGREGTVLAASTDAGAVVVASLRGSEPLGAWDQSIAQPAALRHLVLALPQLVMFSNSSATVLGAARCGDGRVEAMLSDAGELLAGEECDDGNNASGDGCSAECRVEHGWTCDHDPSLCVRWCRDYAYATEVRDKGCSDDGKALLTLDASYGPRSWFQLKTGVAGATTVNRTQWLELPPGVYTAVFHTGNCSRPFNFTVGEGECVSHWVQRYVPVIVVLGTLAIGVAAAAVVVAVVKIGRKKREERALLFDMDETGSPMTSPRSPHNFEAEAKYH
eukprot:m51a1_g13049 hypothetical protein (555) ;mRNA; r:549-2522